MIEAARQIRSMQEIPLLHRDRFLLLRGAGAIVTVAFGISAAVRQGFLKASPDDPQHPGWPAGTPDGRGGKFRPTGGTLRGVAAVRRLAMRRRIRAWFLEFLSLPLEAAANVFPVLGEAVDVIAVAQLAATFKEFQQLDIDTKAALDFLTNGPYSLEDLRVSADSEAFSSYGAFKKRRFL
jgi:hypothetical protein